MRLRSDQSLCDPSIERGILPSVRDRISTVLFIFPNSRDIRHMREPPRLGSRVRSPRGDVWTVAKVIDYGSDTYTAICVGKSWAATVPHRAADQLNEEVKQKKRDRKRKALAVEVLKRAKVSLSPRAIRRRRRTRHYIP
jgi:hypothetical protein